MKKPKKKPTPRTKKNPIRSRDVPATAGMIYDLRDELIERFDRIEKKLDEAF